MDLEKHLELIDIAALKAGSHLLHARKSKQPLEVFTKPDNSIVMNLDLECQSTIRTVLAGSLPILSEEDENSHSLMNKRGTYYIVDPIDGTASCKRFLNQDGGQIGFGPLIGLAIDGNLVAASYYNVPTRALFSASKGNGAYVFQSEDGAINNIPERNKRKRLLVASGRALNESAVLFFPGSLEELKVILYLRNNNVVENTYRLGGFANDCCRVAADFEQIELQCRVKAWDFSAAIIAAEAGLSVTVDPFGKQISLSDWQIAETNSTLIVHPDHKQSILDCIKNAIG